MPVWGWIAIGVGGVLLLAALGAAGYLGWRALERRYLLQLVSRREAVDATRQALEDSLLRLAGGTDAQLHVFADDPDSIERRALHEVASRARILADELDTMTLPKPLVPAADALGDAAWIVGREAGRVNDDLLGDAALEALGEIDLTEIADVNRRALEVVTHVCAECGFEDEAVYGGGLYL